jgi:hypothetical protein
MAAIVGDPDPVVSVSFFCWIWSLKFISGSGSYPTWDLVKMY